MVRAGRRWMLGALALVLAAGLCAWLARGPIAEAIMARAYDRALGPDRIAALPDGLTVALCGSGSPLPDPTRAGPCAAVVAGGRLFVVDVGPGSVKNLQLMRLPPAKVAGLLITHFHSDHIAEVGELMLQHWGGGAATAPLPVYGPSGVEVVVAGFQQAYGQDRDYRIAHHGPKVMPPSGFGATVHPFAISRSGPDVTVIDDGGLKVIAFPVDHGPVRPAVGYLFIYKGRRAVISGDTSASPRVEAEAGGADLLVHEALAPNLVAKQREAALRHGRANAAAILHDILSYHTTPEQAAGIAARAHVRMLLFTHVIPPLPFSALDGPYLGRSRQIFSGTVQVGRDGDFVTLPARGRDIRRGNLLRGVL